MRRYGRRAARLMLILAAAVVIFASGLTLVYLIPNAQIISHARTSAELLKHEGLWPKPMSAKGLQLDNFTDARMIDISIADEAQGPLENALSMNYQNGPTPERSIGGLDVAATGARTHPISYARYWHGYQVALRPLLSLMSYGYIRYVNMLVLFALGLLASLSVRRMLGIDGLVAFYLALLSTGFFIVPMSIQFSSVTYLVLLGTLILLDLERRGVFERFSWEYFALLGALTAFFDLLTAPLLTLGMPLAALLLARARKEHLTLVSTARTVASASLWWAVGFACSWGAKWIVAGLLLDADVLGDALGKAGERSGTSGAGAPIATAIYRNTRMLFPLLGSDGEATWSLSAVLAMAGITAAVGLLLAALLLRKTRTGDPGVAQRLRSRAPVLILAPIPYIWFTALSEHSTVHAWFTYRSLAITIFVVLAVAFAGLTSSASDRQSGY